VKAISSILIFSVLILLESISGWAKGSETPNACTPTRAYQANCVCSKDKVCIPNCNDLILATHPANIWDDSNATKRKTQDALSLIAGNAANAKNCKDAPKKQVLFFLDDWDRIGQYFWQNLSFPGFYEVQSSGGQHQITIDKVSSIYVMGGVFNYCSCRSVRDLIKNHYKKSSEELHFYFVTDALYLNRSYIQFPIGQEKLPNTFTLQKGISRLSNSKDLPKFIEALYFNSAQKDQMCQWGDDSVHKGDYSFQIYNGNTPLSPTLGDPNKPKVHFHYITTKEMEARMKVPQ